MNINSAIIKASKILKNNYIANSRLDSEILMAKTINKNRNFILVNSDQILKKIDLDKFYNLIEQRSSGYPIAYLTRKKCFWTSEFSIANGTLIPRPDTELLVENILRLTKGQNRIKILDMVLVLAVSSYLF